MFCKYCGKELSEDALFCSKCGKQLTSIKTENITSNIQEEIITEKDEVDKTEKVFNKDNPPLESISIEEPIQERNTSNDKYEEDNKDSDKNKQSQDIKNNKNEIKKLQRQIFKNFFIQVFKKHSAQERKELLRIGLADTVSEQASFSADSLKPWFYSRIFLILFAAFIIFEICLLVFDNSNLIPAVMMFGALMVPYSLLTMYFELNINKDISYFKIIGIFLLGGATSLLFTLTLYKLIPDFGAYGVINASLISIIEETGKCLIIIIILKRSKELSVLQGLLIGGAIGAGFQVFESAGYAFNSFLDAYDQSWYQYTDSYGIMNINIFIRAILAFGGHNAWAAIEGAAYAKSKKIDKGFIKYFAICFILHAVWDTYIPYVDYIKLVILCIVPWYVITLQLANFIAEKQESKSTNNNE